MSSAEPYIACERCHQMMPPSDLHPCGPGGRWRYCSRCVNEAESHRPSKPELECITLPNNSVVIDGAAQNHLAQVAQENVNLRAQLSCAMVEIKALTQALHETQQGWAADQNARAAAETTDIDWRELVHRIEGLAANNVTGCDTCTTVIATIRRAEKTS